MGNDILSLLRRDHEDLDKGLFTLLDREKTLSQTRTALDGVRLGLTAHAEAEDIVFSSVLAHLPARDALDAIIREAATSHRQQETALAALVCTPLDSREWFMRAGRLRAMVREHATYEETAVLPAIRELAPNMYPTLAGKFATERLRQLSMLAPSAPVYIADLAAG